MPQYYVNNANAASDAYLDAELEAFQKTRTNSHEKRVVLS